MTEAKHPIPTQSYGQMALLLILRVAIGWHFLYEGIAKMLVPDWTSAGYLENARWILSDLFHWIAKNPGALRIVDLLNIWGLTLVGLCLVLGFLTRFAGVCGMLLLLLYYAANPPLVGMGFGVPAEGHYLIVNKNVVELLALALVILSPTYLLPGLDRLVPCLRDRLRRGKAKTKAAYQVSAGAPEGVVLGRREVFKDLATLPVIGAFIYGTVRKYQWEKVHAITGATIQATSTRLKDLKGSLPKGKIGGKEISRLILGGNMIGGWAHARDLIYANSLFKAYNTEKKIFETLLVAEQAGINTMNIHVRQAPLINKYKEIFGSRLQTIAQVHPTLEDMRGDVDAAIDAGVDLIQIQGNCCDWRVRDGQIDVIGRCVDYIHRQGYLAGLGAHSIQALIECDKAGIACDFYMKTLHHDHYWSAHPRENRVPFSVDGNRSPDHNQFHDNMFCLFPEETIAFMKNKTTPLIAFKVLAGGAIEPADGFRYALENGADFICVGMFDYQIVDDVNIALQVLAGLAQRERPWCA